MELIKIEYILGKKDLEALNIVHTKQPEGRRQITLLLGILTALVIIIMTILDAYRKDEMDWIVWSIVVAIMITLFITLRFKFMTLLNKLLIPLTSKLRGMDRIYGRYDVEFTDNEVSLDSPIGKHIYKWDKFHSVIITQDYLFLYITKGSAFIIPAERAFRNREDELERLLQKLRKRSGVIEVNERVG